jgi:hypothetical protein
MAKIDLDSMSIEELVKLRENVNAKIIEKVAARQLELEAEMEKLSEYGKSAKKPPTSPPAKAKKTEQKKDEEPAGQEPPVAEAA